jgi:hypothetical protein
VSDANEDGNPHHYGMVIEIESLEGGQGGTFCWRHAKIASDQNTITHRGGHESCKEDTESPAQIRSPHPAPAEEEPKAKDRAIPHIAKDHGEEEGEGEEYDNRRI